MSRCVENPAVWEPVAREQLNDIEQERWLRYAPEIEKLCLSYEDRARVFLSRAQKAWESISLSALDKLFALTVSADVYKRQEVLFVRGEGAPSAWPHVDKETYDQAREVFSRFQGGKQEEALGVFSALARAFFSEYNLCGFYTAREAINDHYDQYGQDNQALYDVSAESAHVQKKTRFDEFFFAIPEEDESGEGATFAPLSVHLSGGAAVADRLLTLFHTLREGGDKHFVSQAHALSNGDVAVLGQLAFSLVNGNSQVPLLAVTPSLFRYGYVDFDDGDKRDSRHSKYDRDVVVKLSESPAARIDLCSPRQKEIASFAHYATASNMGVRNLTDHPLNRGGATFSQAFFRAMSIICAVWDFSFIELSLQDKMRLGRAVHLFAPVLNDTNPSLGNEALSNGGSGDKECTHFAVSLARDFNTLLPQASASEKIELFISLAHALESMDMFGERVIVTRNTFSGKVIHKEVCPSVFASVLWPFFFSVFRDSYPKLQGLDVSLEMFLRTIFNDAFDPNFVDRAVNTQVPETKDGGGFSVSDLGQALHEQDALQIRRKSAKHSKIMRDLISNTSRFNQNIGDFSIIDAWLEGFFFGTLMERFDFDSSLEWEPQPRVAFRESEAFSFTPDSAQIEEQWPQGAEIIDSVISRALRGVRS